MEGPIGERRGKVQGLHPDIERVLISQEELHACVADMGRAITQDYAQAEGGVVLVSVLRGAAIFMADLAREIKLPLEMDYMALSSYGSSTRSSGVVRMQKDLSCDIAGRHVIVAEDIIDSGLTLRYTLDLLGDRNPASLQVAALLRKDVQGQPEFNCRYIGFEIPDEFVVGYGLDYAERYRNLPYLGVLKPEVYS
jgi:hypoxanthine phosphoribosyltransferase